MNNSTLTSRPKGDGQQLSTDNQQTAGLSTETRSVLIGLLSRAQVAQRLGVCPHTIQRLTRNGILGAIVFNRRLIRYAPETEDAYIRDAMTTGNERGR